MRILFTTVALPGHFFPLVPLAWACRSHGHEVLVATSDNLVPVAVRSGLPVASIGPAAGVADLRAADAVAHGLEERRYAHGRAFGRIAGRNLAGARSLIRDWRPDLVVSERAEFAGPIAAAPRHIPCVELHWGVAALSEYRSAACEELASELAALGLAGLPEPALVLDPWPPSLRLAHAASHQGMRYVPYNGDAHVPGWLLRPKQKPRICLTLGTVLPHLGVDGLSELVLPVLDSLARLDVDLVVAVDDKIAATWPTLPAAVRYAGWIPLSHVLETCDVSISHAGQGTALTALRTGIPQLVLPQFDDQIDNADALVKAGAGLMLSPEEATPQTIAGCCAKLLDTAQFGSAAAEVAAEIAVQPSTAEIIEALEDLAA